MNIRDISERVAVKIAMENALGIDPMTQKVAEFFRDNPNQKDANFHAWAEEEKLNVHAAEASAYRLATMACEFLFNGRAAEEKTTEKDVDMQELSAGIEVEMEHTSSVAMSKRIALDHLAEIPDYYTRLAKMEEDAGLSEEEA